VSNTKGVHPNGGGVGCAPEYIMLGWSEVFRSLANIDEHYGATPNMARYAFVYLFHIE
jgi:hypothetical protein